MALYIGCIVYLPVCLNSPFNNRYALLFPQEGSGSCNQGFSRLTTQQMGTPLKNNVKPSYCYTKGWLPTTGNFEMLNFIQVK